MLLRQFRIGNNLPTHIRENTDFLREKLRKLPSAEVNFEGCDLRDLEAKKGNISNASSYFKFNVRPLMDAHRSLI